MSLRRALELRRLRHQLPRRPEDFLGGALSSDEERRFHERLGEEIKVLAAGGAELRNHLPIDEAVMAHLSELLARASMLRLSWRLSKAGRSLEKAWKLTARLEERCEVAKIEEGLTGELDEILRRLPASLWELPSSVSARSLLDLARERLARGDTEVARGSLEALQKVLGAWRKPPVGGGEPASRNLARLRRSGEDREALDGIERLLTTDLRSLGEHLLAELDMRRGGRWRRTGERERIRRDLVCSLRARGEVVHQSLCQWIAKTREAGWKI